MEDDEIVEVGEIEEVVEVSEVGEMGSTPGSTDSIHPYWRLAFLYLFFNIRFPFLGEARLLVILHGSFSCWHRGPHAPL